MVRQGVPEKSVQIFKRRLVVTGRQRPQRMRQMEGGKLTTGFQPGGIVFKKNPACAQILSQSTDQLRCGAAMIKNAQDHLRLLPRWR